MNLRKYSIKTKILAAFLLVSLFASGSLALLAALSMNRLARSAIHTTVQLGHSAVTDSKDALLKQAEELLSTVARDQAHIANLHLSRIDMEVSSVATIYAGLLKAPYDSKNILLASNESPPKDMHAFSVFSLAPGVAQSNVENELQLLSELDNIFKFIYSNNPHIKLLYVGTESGIIVKYPWTLTPQGYDPRKRDWYKMALAKPDETVWVGPYVAASTNKLVISCVRAIIAPSGKPIAVAAADISVESISNDFSTSLSEKSGSALMIDKQGNILAQEGMNAEGISWDQSFKTENILEHKEEDIRNMAKKMLEGKRGGIAKIKVNGNVQYVGYAPVLATGWSIGVVAPEDKIVSPSQKTAKRISMETDKTTEDMVQYINEKRKIYVGLCIAFLVIIALMGLYLSKRITAPILQLKKGVAEIGNGHLDQRLNIHTGDEIEDLAATFNKMSDDLKLYIQNLQDTVAAKEKIERDLKVATEIQASMLPRIFPAFPNRKEIDIFASMEPAREVGGDLYDFFFITRNKFFFCIGDVSGKGVPAALFMAITKTLMKANALAGQEPDEILLNLNNSLEPDNSTCMFATIFCGILNTDTGDLTYSNAGHNPPLLRRVHEDKFEFLTLPKSFVVGPLPAEPGRYISISTKLNPGDSLFLYSDGITEAMDTQGQLFGDDALESALNELPQQTNMTETVGTVKAAVRKHALGEPQSDDITILALRFVGNTPPIPAIPSQS